MLKDKTLSFLLLAICTIASLLMFASLRASPPDGHSAELVVKAQTRLQQEGFKPGPIDGIMGPRTRAALRAYQTEHGLEATGRLDGPTLEKLQIEADEGLFEKIGSGLTTAGATVGNAAKTGAKATAEGVTVGAKATAKAVTTGAEATAKGSVKASEAVAEGAAAGGVAVAKAAKTAAEETAEAFDEDSPEEELVDRVREELERHPGVPAEKIRVTAEGPSTVRLTFDGTMTSRERNLAVVAAKRVSGIERVFVRFTQTG